MKTLILASFFSFLFLHIFSQQIVILHEGTKEPLENVAVYNQDRTKSFLTGADGTIPLYLFNETDTLYFQHPSFIHNPLAYSDALKTESVLMERKIIIIPEYVISASKYKETQRDIPHMVDVITPEKLDILNAQNSADLLAATGNVFIQKSQAGGGSPIVRGFEANKILLVVDGIRMNNAIYRSGHLQNSITIDNAILEKTEIIYGTNAIIYGSDALGGVIHYITRDPELTGEEEKISAKALAYSQYSSGNNAWRTHLDFNIAANKFASLTSVTQNNFGDVRMGSYRSPYIPDYGKCFHYVKQINGIDSVLENDIPEIQRHTGYSQIDFLQKFRFNPSPKFDHIINLQYSTSSDIPRYDMLNDFKDSIPVYARWDYGPQDRFLGSVKTIFRQENPFFTNVTAILAYQQIEESRIWRGYREINETNQIENVYIWTGNIDFVKVLPFGGRIVYGLDVSYNYVTSEAFSLDDTSAVKTPAITRYPDDGSNTSSYSGYTAYKMNLGKKFIATTGARYNYSILSSHYKNEDGYLPFRSITMKNSAFTGAAGLIYLHSKSSKVNLLFSTGYRIPNLDDVAKIRAKGDNITLPNPGVKPEYSYNGEIGISKTFNGYLQINANYYTTLLTNAIVRVPYTLPDGADTLYYDGDYLKTYINDNSDKALIYGLNINVISDLNSNVSFNGTFNYTFGRDISNDCPLSHIPPIFGKINAAYKVKRFVHEFYIVYSGWKKTEDMNVTGEDNIEEATSFGYPGWYTLNVRSTWYVQKHITFQLAVENLADYFYKPFATAVAAPGINCIATLKVKI